jgi:hypothetical protein
MSASRSIFVVTTLMTLTISALDFPAAQFQHEIIYTNDASLLTGSVSTPAEIAALSAGSRISTGLDFHQAGNLFHTPAFDAVNLFTPNTVQQPAETPGQFENYRKALEEEAREAEKEKNAVTVAFGRGIGGLTRGAARSYVSVKMTGGDKTYNYGYTI